MGIEDVAQGRLDPQAVAVDDPPVLDEHAVEPFAVVLAISPQMIVKNGPRNRPPVVQIEQRPPLELLTKALDAPVVDEVFDPRVAAVLAVAVVTEDGAHGPNRLHYV